jgi:hypothetical protein
LALADNRGAHRSWCTSWYTRLDPAEKGCTNPDTITPGVLHGTLVFKPDRRFFKTLRLHNLPAVRSATGNGDAGCGGDSAPVSRTDLSSLSVNPYFAATAGDGPTSAFLTYSRRPRRGDGGEANATFSHSISADTGISLTAAPDLSSAHFTAAAGALTGSFDFTRTDATCPDGRYVMGGPASGSVTARFDVIGPITLPSSYMQLQSSNTCQAPGARNRRTSSLQEPRGPGWARPLRHALVPEL